MRFDLVEYRAQFTFKTVQYVKTGGLGSVTDFDVVFLCPPRLLDQHGTLTYEEKLRIDIHEKMDIEDEHILGIGEWRYYLQCDRRIKGGSQNGNKNFFYNRERLGSHARMGKYTFKSFRGNHLCTKSSYDSDC